MAITEKLIPIQPNDGILATMLKACANFALMNPGYACSTLVIVAAMALGGLIYAIHIGGPDMLREFVAKPIQESTTSMKQSIDKLTITMDNIDSRLRRLEGK